MGMREDESGIWSSFGVCWINTEVLRDLFKQRIFKNNICFNYQLLWMWILRYNNGQQFLFNWHPDLFLPIPFYILICMTKNKSVDRSYRVTSPTAYGDNKHHHMQSRPCDVMQFPIPQASNHNYNIWLPFTILGHGHQHVVSFVAAAPRDFMAA